MKKAILITAVSGSGKTTVCKALVELGFVAYDIENVDGLFQWTDDKTGQLVSEYIDGLEMAKGASWNCDKEKLKNLINNEKSDLVFYCGASSNIDEIWNLFDQVVVLQVSDRTTIDRLSGRRPDEYGHTSEVREYILSWKHDAEENWIQKKGGIPVESEDSPILVAKSVVSAIKN